MPARRYKLKACHISKSVDIPICARAGCDKELNVGDVVVTTGHTSIRNRRYCLKCGRELNLV